MAKRVILHIGFHKTGSSALQGFLATNAERLAAAGIGYPYPDPEQIVVTGQCSGNAVQVLHRGGFMAGFDERCEVPAGRMNDAYFDRLIRIIDAVPQPTALVSGEILGLVPKENLTYFFEQIRLSYDVKIVMYVRDVFDFVSSAWRQWLVDAGQLLSFSDYVEGVISGEIKLSMLHWFAFFHGLGLPLSVLNFDCHRRDLAVSFLHAIDENSLIDQLEITTGREVNRSLTPSEACLATLLDKKIKNRDLTATFLRAARTRSQEKAKEYYNRDQYQRILDHFAGTISLINEYLPDDQKLATRVRDRPDIDFVIVPEDAALLLEIVEKLIQSRIEPKGLVNTGNLTAPVVLPSDFDADAYLFHNPDVAAAKIDPMLHYLAHGWQEGRRYRFF